VFSVFGEAEGALELCVTTEEAIHSRQMWILGHALAIFTFSSLELNRIRAFLKEALTTTGTFGVLCRSFHPRQCIDSAMIDIFPA
jgi:hypothetical protein